MDLPAILGGKPVFSEMLPIIRPTLISPHEVINELEGIFESGLLTQGCYGDKLEQAIQEYLGVKNVIAVSSCTSGLILMVQALGLKGEVIVPSFTFAATVHSLVWNRLQPVFVDCQETDGNVDLTKIEEKITSRTSAIMAVVVFGNPPRIKELSEIANQHNLRLVFDTAQGLGSVYQGKLCGNFGDGEVFSLSPTKVLTGGEGGLVATNDVALAQKIRQARDYGKINDGEDIGNIGLSARLAEFNALLSWKQLPFLEGWVARRNNLIGLYRACLSGIAGISFPQVHPENRSSGNYMVIFIDEEKFELTRDQLYLALQMENIQTKKYFYPPIHKQSAYSKYQNQHLPVTERLSRSSLALPLYSHMAEETLKKICQAIERIHNYREMIKMSEEKCVIC